MRTVALIVAGGAGTRMGQDIPKQFINVFDRPVLVYTLESFQRHPEVDAIEVVCIDGWSAVVEAYAKQFNITKLKWVAPGGKSVQESIHNGVEHLTNELDDGDIVIIHDGIRPLTDSAVLTDVIRVCKRYGNAVTSTPYNEQIFLVDQGDPSTTTQYIPREVIRRVSTPQAYRFGKLRDVYRKAFAQGIGIGGSSYTNTLMVDMGERLHFAEGSDKNIKLTTRADLELFKAYITSDEDSWLK
ncbi:MAG: 2-C-methyl-D-erythritol 4-phosphate cytidylyltransferase [Bifidobacterium sp.]|jgi:2-C-methyl-D-erythritol 4-phosphate cytidylyltransferase|nr:2-C-methyl-D-erythritol 4-phosphate cytidylyltransferase [Bifidobacterium sp.]